jgi:uncharacterized protein VirK/YbjX
MRSPAIVLCAQPTGPFTAWKFATCVTRQIYRDWAWNSILAKSIGRGFGAARISRDYCAWTEYLLRPENREFAEANPQLWLRNVRGYLSVAWSPARRRKVLEDSYRFALTHPGPMLRALYPREETELATIPLGGENGSLRLTLASEDAFSSEGEWAIRVYSAAHSAGNTGCLSAIAFSVDETESGWVGYIGALQGGGAADEASVKASTKAMHGVRPKAMAIFALQELASSLGLVRLLGAGSSIQMSNAKHAIPLPWKKISFNYDAMWSEADGKPAEDGWYELPLREVRRSRDEIKPNKRPLYARRYALFDQIQAAVAEATRRA